MVDRLDTNQILTELVNKVPKNGTVTVLTGAGVSTESGIPTFREAQVGLWSKYNPQELATPQAFSADPQLVWDWYNWRRQLVAKALPNPGHQALAALEHHLNQESQRCEIITQNVDGLHQRAGSRCIIELHGNIMREKCSRCFKASITPLIPSSDSGIPLCPNCGGLYRPDVVWFGEQLPENALESAWQASQNCDIFLSIGTSAVVEPAASLPLLAHQNKAIVIEVNTVQTPLTPYASFTLYGRSSKILPQLIKVVWDIELNTCKTSRLKI